MVSTGAAPVTVRMGSFSVTLARSLTSRSVNKRKLRCRGARSFTAKSLKAKPTSFADIGPILPSPLSTQPVANTSARIAQNSSAKNSSISSPNVRAAVLHSIHLLTDDHKVRKIEHEVSLPGGGVGWLQWTTYAILTPDGSVAEFQAIGTDVTDRKRAEEAQENLAHASRLAVVGELTAMVAHEINQPLTAILHNAEAGVKFLNLSKPPLDEIKSILTDIMENEVRASQSILRIRALLQKRDMELQPLNLNEVASDVLRMVTGDAIRRRVEIKSNLDPQLPLIYGDRIHLQQVLLNLIMNGMDAIMTSPEGHRQLLIETARKDNETNSLSVADSGPGIPTGLLPYSNPSSLRKKMGWASVSRLPNLLLKNTAAEFAWTPAP